MHIKLVGKHITLREINKKDATSIYQYAKDKDICKWTNMPYPYKRKYASEFIKKTKIGLKKKTGYELGIELNETKEIIGMIGLMNKDKKSKNAELGYWVAQKYQKQGIATEATKLIIHFAFKQLKLEKIYAKVYHPNLPSQKLLLKKGFKLEGHLRKHKFRNNEWYDELMFGLLREEYTK